MQRMNWRIVAAGGVIALILVAALVRSRDPSVVVAGGQATPVATTSEIVEDEPVADDDAPLEISETPTSAVDPTAQPTAIPAPSPMPAPVPSPTPTPEPAPEATSAPSPTATVAPSGDDDEDGGTNQAVTSGQGCLMYLHGAGTAPGDYDEPWAGGIKYLAPHSGNDEFPWFWLYDGPHNMANDPGDSTKPYDDLVAYLTDYLDQNDCGPVMLYGASAGGGFAAKIYCSGEDFGGRMWGIMVDDPVPDAGVVGCSPSPNVQRTLFIHSTELAETPESFTDDRCSQSSILEFPWYCQDDIGFDLAEYEAHIGQKSVWGREEHLGFNTDETNFWAINLGWWYDFDPVTYAELEGR